MPAGGTGQRFARKSDWAAAQAAELQQRAAAMRYESSGGSVRRAARKFDAIRRLEGEAERFMGIAAALRARGK